MSPPAHSSLGDPGVSRGLPGGAARRYDVAVIGGGTSGAALAGVLAAQSDLSVLLLEAGPDYGPLAAGRWPPELLDYKLLPTSHQWGYDSAGTYPDRKIVFERARVIGGCSSHNGCAAIWGSAVDYDDWSDAGNTGWSTRDLHPLFKLAMNALAVRTYSADEITPFHRLALEAAPLAGIPIVDDLNDLASDTGIAPFPVNVVDGIRFNAAFAFLDPIRGADNLTVVGDTLVDRVRVEGGQVTAVEARRAGTEVLIRADRIVLAAGAYGSPAILMRSGIGPGEALRSAGIEPRHELPGVGENLHDHPSVVLRFAGGSELSRMMDEFADHAQCPEEQTIAKARSPHCERAFDLHLCPIGGPDPERPDSHRWTIMVACMDPHSRGRIQLQDPDPESVPRIDHRYLSDEHGHDLRTLSAGVDLAREFAGVPAFADMVGAELTEPGMRPSAPQELIEAGSVHYYHPVGTCKMGPSSDERAVVDPTGAVHGVEGLYVADCSIMPVVPRANTNIPAAVVGLKIARGILGAD
jgi:choline dehydrogenase